MCEKVICELSYYLSILWPLNKDCALSEYKTKTHIEEEEEIEECLFQSYFPFFPSTNLSSTAILISSFFFPNMTSTFLHLHFYSSFPTLLNALPLFSQSFSYPVSKAPGGTSSKEPAFQGRRPERNGFDPWVRKITWRRKWQPTPVFLP